MAAVCESTRPYIGQEDIFEESIFDGRKDKARGVYALYVQYSAIPSETERERFLNEKASRTQHSATTIRRWLDVPERIPLQHLTEAFPTSPDGTGGWWTHLKWEHLQKAAEAGGKKYTAPERVGWLIHAADHGLNPDEMADHLRRIEVIKTPKRGKRWTEADGEREAQRLTDLSTAYHVLKEALQGDMGDNCQAKAAKLLAKLNGVEQEVNPSSFWTLLQRIGDSERAAGRDMNLAGTFAKRAEQGKPPEVNVQAFLAWGTGEYKREPFNAATFTLDSSPKEEKTT